MCMATQDEFVWLELKPQQNFKDDDDNQILKITKSASEFAFFVLKKDDAMRIIIRARASEKDLFRTLRGLTVSEAKIPDFESMVTRYLVQKNKTSLVPLLDPARLEKSDMYQKMWNREHDSIMACFVCKATEKCRSEINSKITSLEAFRDSHKGRLPSKKKAELAAAIKKQDGNYGYYNCCIVFGMEYAGSQQDRAAVKEPLDKIDNLIGIVSSNRFKDRIARKRAKFSYEDKTFLQRIFEIFHPIKTINPLTFVPEKLRSKSMVLTANELAYFISLPEEYDIQTVNFEMGPNPTFMHGKTEDIDKTDLDVQKTDEEPPDDRED
ncbi:MAG: hypothetical protein KGI11_09720 [Thaumarchaeota archaeon]|nr:hypothetical protein [Nitrososphaerota archaeon]